jgi:hypothetical protein
LQIVVCIHPFEAAPVAHWRATSLVTSSAIFTTRD